MATHTVVAVLAVCCCGVQGFPYQAPFYFTPRVTYQPLSLPLSSPLSPLTSYYSRPFHALPLPSSHHFTDFGAFYQPQVPPFFARPDPSNATVHKPTVAPPTDVRPAPEKPNAPETDVNGTSVDFDDIFKTTAFSPSPDFVARVPVRVSSPPVFPQYVVPATPGFGDFPRDDIDRAYGLPGFRPFYYDGFLGRQNSTDCDDSSAPCKKDLSSRLKAPEADGPSPHRDELKEVIDKIYKPDPNIVVFNTPSSKSSHQVETDDKLDVRSGTVEEKRSDDAFYQAYKDIMFLNRSYLSTVAPYLHK